MLATAHAAAHVLHWIKRFSGPGWLSKNADIIPMLRRPITPKLILYFITLLLKAYGSKKQNIINNWVPSTFQNYHEPNRGDTLYNPKRGERIKMSYLVWLYLYENDSSLTIKILFIADGSKKAGPSCGSKTTPRSSPESDRVSQSQKSIQVNLFFSGIFFEKNSLCLKHHVLFAGNIASPS